MHLVVNLLIYKLGAGGGEKKKKKKKKKNRQ